MLYVADPLALRKILVEDSNVFDEPPVDFGFVSMWMLLAMFIQITQFTDAINCHGRGDIVFFPQLVGIPINMSLHLIKSP